MNDNANRAPRPVFRSIHDDGREWLFAIGSVGWVITRNGLPVVAGAGTASSISFGVQKFRSLTAAADGDNAGRRAMPLAESAGKEQLSQPVRPQSLAR